MEDKIRLPEVIITGNGARESLERVNPAALTFILQASATAQLARLRKLEESKVPVGVKQLQREGLTSDPIEVHIWPAWISCALVVDSGSLYYGVNEQGRLDDRVPILSGETVSVNMDYPVIRSLWLRATSGTANVRINAKEGIPAADRRGNG